MEAEPAMALGPRHGKALAEELLGQHDPHLRAFIGEHLNCVLP